MFHTSAYYKSNLGAVAWTDIPGVVDQYFVLQNNHLMLPHDFNLIAGRVGSATALRSRLSAPSLVVPITPKIWPVEASLLPTNNPNMIDYTVSPLRIGGVQELALQSTAAPGTTEPHFGVFFFQDTPEPTPVGQISAIRGTGATTLVAGVWNDVAVTWDDSLPAGRYAVVGGTCQSAGCIGWRLIFDNQMQRPGGIGVSSIANRPPRFWQSGRLGKWGSFPTNVFPRLQVLSATADTTEEIILDIVQISTSLAA